MQHLTPVGLSKDGTQLVLVSESGEEFAVPVDHRFRTALRGDQARLGQLEMKMESALRPRDIQSRIRGGETAEQVAAAAQTTVEAIMAFAAPVLAERAHVAQTALKSSIRRASSEASPVARTLDEASRMHLSTVSVRADDVEWDAWRREDGRWSLVAEYIAGDDLHRAEFSYDQPGRYVLAENDEARLLTGESAPVSTEPAPARRLSAVPSSPDELPLGDDALELVREVPAAAAPTHHEVVPQDRAEEDTVVPEDAADTSDLTETAAAVRGEGIDHGSAAFDDLAADHADADWITPGNTAPEEPAAPVERESLSIFDDPAPVAPPVPEEPEQTGVAEQAPTKKKGRSSVPSWDEIMFGGGKHE